MAIARDTNSSGSASSTSVTFAHTCTGSDLFLAVAERNHSTSANVPTSVTYNGTGMTNAVSAGTGGRVNQNSLWYLANPDSGSSYNVVVTYGSSSQIYAVAASYTGVAQSSPIDTTGSYDSLTTLVSTIPISVTVGTSGSWAVMTGMAQSDLATLSASTNATSVTGNVFDNQGYGDIAAGSFSMTLSLSEAKRAAGTMMVFKSSDAGGAGAGAFASNINLLGVG